MQFWRMRRSPLARGEGDLSLTNHIVEAYVKNVLQPTRSGGHLRHAPSQDAPMNEEGAIQLLVPLAASVSME